MLYKRKEAAQRLNIEPKTLDDWVKKAGMHYGKDERRDGRWRLLSDEQLDELAHLHSKPVTLADTIEQRLAALEAAIETLRERSPYLFSAAERAATPPERPARVLDLPLSPPRQKRGTARHMERLAGKMDQYPPLPPGWVSVSTWGKQHNLNGKSVPREIGRGILPTPAYGEWQPGSGGLPIQSAYTPEQHAAADRAAAAFWPDRFRPCALSLDAIDATTPQRSEED